MLMSHSIRPENAYIRYRVKVVTGKRLTGVRPFWLRANGCGKQVSYPVPGGGPPGSTSRRSSTWRVPMDGRIVAVGGHLHGSAKNMWLSQPRCHNRRLLDTAPRYGMPNHLYYRARPILHEPGPIDTRYFLSRTGIPVRRGERIRITGTYEGTRPHPRVMSIMHVYIAPTRDVPKRCKALPADAKELEKPGPVRTEPPQVVVPLNGVRPNGRTFIVKTPADGARRLKKRATVSLRAGRFTPAAHLGAARREGHLALRRRDPAQRPARERPAADRHADPEPRRDQVLVLPQARALRAVLLPAPDDDARGGRRAATPAPIDVLRGPRRTAGPSGSGCCCA